MAAGAAVVGAVCLYTYTHDPRVPGVYPPCPLYTWTGLYCPGCGGTRSLHALLHGDLAQSLQQNPFVVVALCAAAILALRALQARRHGSARRPRPPLRLLVLLPTVMIAFGVLRNIPGFEWMQPT